MKRKSLFLFLLSVCFPIQLVLADCVPTKTLISDNGSCNSSINQISKTVVWDVMFGSNGPVRVVPHGIGYCGNGLECWPAFFLP